MSKRNFIVMLLAGLSSIIIVADSYCIENRFDKGYGPEYLFHKQLLQSRQIDSFNIDHEDMMVWAFVMAENKPLDKTVSNSFNENDIKTFRSAFNFFKENYTGLNWKIDTAIIFLTAVILVLSLGGTFMLTSNVFTLGRHLEYTVKNIREESNILECNLNRRMDRIEDHTGNKINKAKEDIQAHLGVLVQAEVSKHVENLSSDMRRQTRDLAETILEDHFVAHLEERYLAVETVSSALWARVTSAVQKFSEDQSNPKIITEKILDLVARYHKVCLGLRRMLSSDDKEVYQGIGILRSLNELNMVPEDEVWNFIFVLKKQGRLSPRNLAFAADFGYEIKKSFAGPKNNSFSH